MGIIDFFTFLNGCSPSRTLTYLVFVLIFLFVSLHYVQEIIKIILDRKPQNGLDEKDGSLLDEGDMMD